MSAPSLNDLRRQLREKFPQAHGVRAGGEHLSAEKPFQPESFPAGAISEVIPTNSGAGLMLLVAGLLGEPEEENPHPDIVLIDGADGFDPSSFTGTACSRLLWVRCASAPEMLKAADLIVRDGNVPFVLIDASALAHRDLASIPSSSWWRLRHLLERTGGRLVVLSPSPIVPGASLRLSLSAHLSLHDFDAPRQELLARLTATPQSLRHAT